MAKSETDRFLITMAATKSIVLDASVPQLIILAIVLKDVSLLPYLSVGNGTENSMRYYILSGIVRIRSTVRFFILYGIIRNVLSRVPD